MRNLINKFLLGICLLASPSLLSSEMDDRAVTEKYRVEYQDPVKLKSRLLNMLSTFEGFDGTKIERLKKQFDISDEIMSNVAVEIYHESVKALSEKTPAHAESVLNAYKGQVDIALFCLGLSADQDAKQLLMTIATNNDMEMSYRRQAISAYFRASDAEEVKNALIRFLVKEDRMDSLVRLSLYGHAGTAYDVASPEKKAAIVAALITAANREEGKIEFMKVDKILAGRSDVYRYSRERLAMLERHSLAPPTTNLYTDRDLKAALEECRKYKTHTSISTNLAVLKARDFNLPLPAGEKNELLSSESNIADADEKSNNVTRSDVALYAVLGVITLILLSLGAWRLTRKQV